MHPSLRGRFAIVGVGESDDMGVAPHASSLALHSQAAANAVADSGLERGDVDGIFTAGRTYSMEVAEYLGLQPRYVDGTSIGGCSFLAHVEHAMAAIDAGLCRVALVTHGESGRSRVGIAMSELGWPGDSIPVQYEFAHGLVLPATTAGLVAARHMHEFGTTRRQLAEVAVATRAWAGLNPRALRRDPLTIDDVLGAPMISSPLGRLDCCQVTDAGAACVVMRAADARAIGSVRPVHVLGSGEAVQNGWASSIPDYARHPASKISGAAAFRMAGLAVKDIDVALLYDAFTITPLLALEALGFCPEGEGGDFVANGRTGPGGDFPMNTNGGGLSYTHTGMYGMFMIVEAVRQLRGDCGPRQVPSAKVAVCHGPGGWMSAAATLVLGSSA